MRQLHFMPHTKAVFVTLFSFLFPIASFSQTVDTLFLQTVELPNGFTISIGDTLIIGKPSQQASYKHFHPSSGLQSGQKQRIDKIYRVGKPVKKDYHIVFQNKGQIIDCELPMAAISGEVKYPISFLVDLSPMDTKQIPLKGDQPHYTFIFDFPGQSQSKLYTIAKLAMTSLFKSPNDVIQIDDPTGGRIIAKGYSQYIETDGSSRRTQNWFTFEVSIKDNKIRVQMYGFTLKRPDQYGYTSVDVGSYVQKDLLKNRNSEWLYNFHNNCLSVIGEFESLLISRKKSEQDDW